MKFLGKCSSCPTLSSWNVNCLTGISAYEEMQWNWSFGEWGEYIGLEIYTAHIGTSSNGAEDANENKDSGKLNDG
jgi:hypothetical protein